MADHPSVLLAELGGSLLGGEEREKHSLLQGVGPPPRLRGCSPCSGLQACHYRLRPWPQVAVP